MSTSSMNSLNAIIRNIIAETRLLIWQVMRGS